VASFSFFFSLSLPFSFEFSLLSYLLRFLFPLFSLSFISFLLVSFLTTSTFYFNRLIYCLHYYVLPSFFLPFFHACFLPVCCFYLRNNVNHGVTVKSSLSACELKATEERQCQCLPNTPRPARTINSRNCGGTSAGAGSSSFLT
jgi:hypothetical protein